MKALIRRTVWPLYFLVLAIFAGVEVSSYLEASAKLERIALAGQEAATAYDITGNSDTDLANETGTSSTAIAVLEKQASLGRTVQRIVVAGSILGIASFLVYAWSNWQRRARFSI